MSRRWAAVTVLVLCAACTTDAEPPTASAEPSTPVTSRTPPPRDPATTPEPATSAGPLTIEAFPEPAHLGRGWAYRVEPGDAEAGYVGNGTPGLERDPAEVSALAVPLGCPRPAELPRAEHAFEVDYTYTGQPVVAVRLEFERPSNARRFEAARHTNLSSCLGRSGGPAIGPYVGTVRGSLNDRTPESEPWTELVVRRGTGVLLLAAPTAFGQRPFDRAGTRRIVTAADGG